MKTATMENTTRAMAGRRAQSSPKRDNTIKDTTPKALTAFTRRTNTRKRPSSLRRTMREATAKSMEGSVIKMNTKREDIKRADIKKKVTKKGIMEGRERMLKGATTGMNTDTTAKEDTNTIINTTLNMATSRGPAMERNGDGGKAKTVAAAAAAVEVKPPISKFVCTVFQLI
ncbi:hypothetical protein HUJ04_009760, partial [Dendroctonus ponderosae]